MHDLTKKGRHTQAIHAGQQADPATGACSVPIYQATGSRKKAVWQSFATGLAEPLGALVVWLALQAKGAELIGG